MANYSKLQIRKRMTILFLIVVFLMFSLLIRLVWVQVVSSAEFQKKALNQRLRESRVEPRRGVIYDRNGEELAVSGTAESILAIPAEVRNPEQTARQLASILTMPYDEILRRLNSNVGSVWLNRKVNDDVSAKVRELNLPGITFTPETARYYPKNELAAHIIGFTGIDQGLEGLEHTLDSVLKGVPGRVAVERDARNRELPNGVQKYFPPEDGDNVYLTIDHVIQYIAERELDAALTKVRADGGTVIVMNPKTGEILAMANRPTYNPNEYLKHQDLWKNISVSAVYEPGSTFKVITAAAALEEGVVNINDPFFCKGSIVVAGALINCWKDGGHGAQTFAEVVENSCNPGFVQIGQRLGAEAFNRYIDAFGFGKRTELGLSGEEIGIRYTLPQIGPVQLATMSFGHSISVTPIQLITAISAVANDGLLMRPQIVREIHNSKGEVVKLFKPEPVRQVLSKETALLTRQLLGDVVEEGTGQNAQVPGYEIGGKTGTAQHYGDKRSYDTSFIGFVPVEDPQLVILVVLYSVTSYPHFGSQTAAPIFQKVATNVLRYLEIPPQNLPQVPTGRLAPKNVEIPNVRNLHVDQAREVLKKSNLMVKIEGQGEMVVDQVPVPGATMLEQSTVVLFTQDGLTELRRYQVTIPDLTGVNARNAAQILADLGLRANYPASGGTVTNQVPAPHTRVDSGTEVKLFVR